MTDENRQPQILHSRVFPSIIVHQKMELVNSSSDLSVAVSVENIVRSYLETENILFSQRRELVIILFERAGITSLPQFEEIRNSIKLAYISNFQNTVMYKQLIPSENFVYDDKAFINDQMFYDEGFKLMRESKKRKKLGYGKCLNSYQQFFLTC